MIELRPYQQQAIGRLRAAISSGKSSPLLVSPTGSGKTRMFAYLVSRLAQNGKRCVVLDHRDELTEQISQALQDVKTQHGIIAAGARYYDKRLLTHVASVFTLARRLDRVEVPDYVIIDEAHHCVAGTTWGKVVTRWRELNPNLKIIGVTATPERLGGEGLGQVFDCMVMGPTVAELIADGWLSPYKLFAPPPRDVVDFSGIKSRGGDFDRGQVSGALDKPTITGSAVAQYRKHCNGAPAVAFCSSVQHAEHVAETFRAQGYRSASIDGKMDKPSRRALVEDFRSGRISVLTSADLISEGFDLPGMVGAILLRPTQSLALYLQQVGRSLRIAPGKTHAVLLDHVGNWERHGLPDDEREWSLEGHERKKKGPKDPDDVTVKQCPSCYAVCRSIVARCDQCGHTFKVASRKVAEVEGELEEIDPAVARARFMQARASAANIESLAQVGRMRGMKNPEGWARHVLQARADKQARRYG